MQHFSHLSNLIGLEVSEIMSDRGQPGDEIDHVAKDMVGAVTEMLISASILTSEQCSADHLVVLCQAQRTLRRAHECDESIMLVRISGLFRLAVDICHGIVRQQR